MIVNVGVIPTPIQQVRAGDLIFNTGIATAYVDTIQASVIQAPLSSAIPVLGGSTVQWAGSPGLLYGKDPTGNAPGIGVTSQSGLPFPAPVGGANFLANRQGLFWYSPLQGRGNLKVAISPGGAGTDPYGNVFPQGTNFGVWSATGVLGAHFGIDDNGNAYVAGSDGVTRIEISNGTAGIGIVHDPAIGFFNDFGAVILVVDPAAGGVWQYIDTGSATQGALAGAQISKNASDPVFGNPYNAGVNIIDPVFGDSLAIVGATIRFASVPWNNSGVVAGTGGTPSGNVGPGLSFTSPTVSGAPNYAAMALFGESANTTLGPGLVLAISASPPVKQTGSLLEVQGSVSGVNGSSFWTVSTASDGHGIYSRELELTNVGSAPAAPSTGIKIFAINGRFYVIDSDGNIYALGDKRLIGTGNPQLVNSTGFTTVAGLTTNLGVGTYEVEGFVVLEGVAAAAGNPEFQFNGTAVIGSMHVTGMFHPETGAGIAINGANATALASTMIGQVLSITATQVFDFHGTVNVTTAGSFHLDAACSVAADTYDIFGPVSYMNIKPT